MAVGLIYNPVFLEHIPPGNPDQPERLLAILQLLKETGLYEKLVILPGRAALREELLSIHSEVLVNLIEQHAESGVHELDSDTFVSTGSFLAASMAAGSAVMAAQLVCDGSLTQAFVLSRPPGHHATARRAMGFCLFNHIAIAAHCALQNGWAHKIAIIDFDVHHGNGTASSFANEPRILYVSTHQWPLFPGTGDWREIGFGAGRGYTLNIPLPPRTGDIGYLRVFDELIKPAVYRFGPELVLVSAGYDAHWADPLADMLLSTEAFRQIGTLLLQWAEDLCRGRLVYILEGGYHLQALAAGVAATISVLLGAPYQDILGPSSLKETDIGDLPARIARYHQLIR